MTTSVNEVFHIYFLKWFNTCNILLQVSERCSLKKIWGKENPADMLTKGLNWDTMDMLLGKVGGRFVDCSVGMIDTRRGRRR